MWCDFTATSARPTRSGRSGRQHGPHGHGQLLDGPDDPEPRRVERGDVRGVGVAQQDVVTGADELGRDGPADGARSHHQGLHDRRACGLPHGPAQADTRS